MSFDNWRKRLEAAKLPTVAERRAAVATLKINFSKPQPEDEGYYRKPITEAVIGANGKTNGQQRVVGWKPVAYFMDRGMLCGVIGDRDMAINEVTDEGLWSWVVGNPISEELFRAVNEHGESWPDLPEGILDRAMGANADDQASLQIPAASRTVERTDNQPPPEKEIPLHEQHATKINTAVAAAPTGVPKTAAEHSLMEGSKNRIAELRLDAFKTGKAIYEPLFRVYTAEQKLWSPMVAVAEAKERELATNIKKFLESERVRIAQEKIAAEAKQREIDEANERAAQRAIAQGEPEPALRVEDVVVPIPEAPAKVVPTYGKRSTKADLKTFVEIDDFDQVYQYFKGTEEVKTLLTALAQAMVTAGRTVPGTHTREGIV